MTQKNIAQHILPSSATMVGVCITSISIVKLIEERTGDALRIDEYLALVSLIFLMSAGLSYFSLRTAEGNKTFERLADMLFMGGLFAMSVVGVLFAYEVI